MRYIIRYPSVCLCWRMFRSHLHLGLSIGDRCYRLLQCSSAATSWSRLRRGGWIRCFMLLHYLAQTTFPLLLRIGLRGVIALCGGLFLVFLRERDYGSNNYYDYPEIVHSLVSYLVVALHTPLSGGFIGYLLVGYTFYAIHTLDAAQAV